MKIFLENVIKRIKFFNNFLKFWEFLENSIKKIKCLKKLYKKIEKSYNKIKFREHLSKKLNFELRTFFFNYERIFRQFYKILGVFRKFIKKMF